MSAERRILLVCNDPNDRELAGLVLRHTLGDVEVLEAADALAFAEQLSTGSVSVAIANDTLGWGQGGAVLAAVKRRNPSAITVLLGRDRTDDPSVDACVVAGTAGFLELPSAIRRVEQARLPRRAPVADHAYERLTERLPVGLFGMTEAGAIIKANPALFRLLGFIHEADLIGRQLPDLCDDTEARLRLRVLLERGESVRDFQTRLRRAGGDIINACLSFWPGAGGEDERVRFQGVLWSISALHEGRPDVTEPETSNERYEQLAYAVSHDLQDPLQLIQQYARLLLDKYESALEPDASRLVQRLVDCTDRMQAMMDGILEYSKVGVESRPLEVVDLDDVLHEALANLQASVQASSAEVEFEGLPSIIGDRRLLVQLFQNLIGNGIKFCADDTPRITVKVESREDEWLVSVADNGIGIDGRFAERIFDMFQRLHTSDEYPGTGIGLALCKRIAERHEGRIWVRSEPGRGSTFFVTISKHLSASLSEERSDKMAG